MAHFQKLVVKFKNKILEFKDGPINIVVCHLNLDSLVSAFAMKCFVLCVLGSNRPVKIFCDDELDSFLQSVCRFFNLSCSMDRESISTFIDTGNNIFINWGSDITKKIPNVVPVIVMGDVDSGVIQPPKNDIIFLGGNHISISAVMFKIFCEAGYFQSMKETGDLPFLLALAVEFDTNRMDVHHALHNMSVLGRILHFIGFTKFHDLIDGLPKDILKSLNLR